MLGVLAINEACAISKIYVVLTYDFQIFAENHDIEPLDSLYICKKKKILWKLKAMDQFFFNKFHNTKF